MLTVCIAWEQRAGFDPGRSLLTCDPGHSSGVGSLVSSSPGRVLPVRAGGDWGGPGGCLPGPLVPPHTHTLPGRGSESVEALGGFSGGLAPLGKSPLQVAVTPNGNDLTPGAPVCSSTRELTSQLGAWAGPQGPGSLRQRALCRESPDPREGWGC